MNLHVHECTVYDPRRHIYLGSYTEAMDQPTVLYILYTMVSAQQTNLLPKNASQNDAIYDATTSQYLSSYGCTITMVYIYIYLFIYLFIYLYICMYSNQNLQRELF